MKDLDKVLEVLVGETKIVFKKENLKEWGEIVGRIQYSFKNSSSVIPSNWSRKRNSPLRNTFDRNKFIEYSKNQFGLTDKEINKVLKEFRTIISDKIESKKMLNK